ncbi:MAG: gamma-glutamylcyclotransferase family protein [Cyanobacteria bacterium P01_C01_bin.72]
MKSELSTLNVFVYGTLKPGEANFAPYCQDKISSQTPAYTWGELYALSLGYPAMTTGKNKIQGVILALKNWQVLQDLDRLEGYQVNRPAELNEYDRTLVTVYGAGDRQLGQAWAYYMTLEKVRQYGGTKVNSGCWTGGK